MYKKNLILQKFFEIHWKGDKKKAPIGALMLYALLVL